MISLPIDAVVPALRQALGAQHQAVLEAPPGAGKTTRVPLALLDEPWLAGQRILMLEPRRLAARAAAERLAAELGEKVGETVGYRIRLESRVGPKTRIEVVTEGILARRLQDDPALDGVGLVIFDEFHVLPFASKKPDFCQNLGCFAWLDAAGGAFQPAVPRRMKRSRSSRISVTSAFSPASSSELSASSRSATRLGSAPEKCSQNS